MGKNPVSNEAIKGLDLLARRAGATETSDGILSLRNVY